MHRLKAIILDDEKCSCERLRRILSSFDFVGDIWCSTNSLEGAKIITEKKPEIIFLDIELENNVTGFEVIDKINRNDYHPFIIIITGHPQYSIKAIRHGVFDYIMKPIDIDELKKSLDRLLTQTLYKSKIKAEFRDLSIREREILLLVL